MNHLLVHTHRLFDLYVWIKFEVDHCFRYKVMIGFKNFAWSQTLFTSTHDCKKLISCTFLLPALPHNLKLCASIFMKLGQDPISWKLMHIISNYCGNKHHPPTTTNTQTHTQDRIQYAVSLINVQCKYPVTRVHSILYEYLNKDTSLCTGSVNLTMLHCQ